MPMDSKQRGCSVFPGALLQVRLGKPRPGKSHRDTASRPRDGLAKPTLHTEQGADRDLFLITAQVKPCARAVEPDQE